MAKKKTNGRQKIEIKKIQGIGTRQVTFSKRRKGLFNKVGELCVLTGAEILILAQSIGGRVHAFAHPNVDSVIDTFLGNNIDVSNPNQNPGIENVNNACMYEKYKKKYLEIAEEIEVEKEKLNNVKKSDEFWWENSFEDLAIDEFEIFIDSMEELKNNVTKKVDELLENSDINSSLNNIANANIIDGLVDDQDQFLQNNVGFANENLMMPPVNFDYSGFINNYSFESGKFAGDNHENEHNDDLQVQSDFGTVMVSDDLYFGEDFI